jgi:Flp pilus assembly protein TadB
MAPTALYYALSTIAQCAAALAALIGFLGLWRQDRLRERLNAVDQDIERLSKERMNLIFGHIAPGSRDHAYLERLSHFDQHIQEANTHRADVQAEQRRLMDVLVRFLIGTLTLLVVAVVGLAFAEGLHIWVWPMRAVLVIASLWLGAAPAYVVLHAAGRARAVHQRRSPLRYQLRRVWRRGQMWRGPAPIVEWVRGQWVRIRQYWSERGWPMLQRWGAQARTRIRRS